MTGLAELPEFCQRIGCFEPIQTWCPLCELFYCAAHDRLPGGHACLVYRLTPGRLWHVLVPDSEPPLGRGEWNVHACSGHAELDVMEGGASVTACDCPAGVRWCQAIVENREVEPPVWACGWPGWPQAVREGPIAVGRQSVDASSQ